MLSCENLTVRAGADGPVILDGANARFLPRGSACTALMLCE